MLKRIRDERPKRVCRSGEVADGLPFLVWVEALFIWIPILFHSIFGSYIWYRGESNVRQYPWLGNWMYSAQRWTGAVMFAYIVFYTNEMRFSGWS